MCSNDNVVKGGSRTVINEIKSPWFGEVFPHLKYDEADKNFFLKETDGEWKLKNCKLMASYNATTTNSNVVGQRASKRIHIDDLYPDYKEAMNKTTNDTYFNDYQKMYINKRCEYFKKYFCSNSLEDGLYEIVKSGITTMLQTHIKLNIICECIEIVKDDKTFKNISIEIRIKKKNC